MGFRFRKSINLGGGFKVNLGKSGVGYSWGTKGVRITKTAKGTKRTTLSIPGTGISYVTETSEKKKTINRNSNTHFQNSYNNQGGNDLGMKKFGKFSKNVALWILTVFFVAAFFVYVPHIASFIALAAAAFLAPVQTWQDLIGKYAKGKLKTIAAILLIILTFATTPTAETTDNDIPPEIAISVVDETTETTEETASRTEATIESVTEVVTELTTEETTEPATEATPEPETEPTTAPTTEPTENKGRDYVLNTNTKKFHYPSCSSAKDIKTSNRKEYHGTREDVIAMGYVPCKRCNP